MARIVVTGGSGFIGSNLVGELLQQGNDVTVFDSIELDNAANLDEFKSHRCFSFIKGDVTDPDSVDACIVKGVDYVYHLAAVVGIKHYIGSPMKLIDINVMGTRNVLEAALKAEAKVIFTSTSEIYGNNPNPPWKETHDRVLGPTSVDRWNYSSSKAMCEHMLFAMHRCCGLKMTIVRYFNVYGPNQQPYFVVSQSVHNVVRGKKPLLYDGGSQTRCFTFIGDAVKGTILAAESSKGDGEVFNIGSDKETSIKEVIDMIIQLSGKDMVPEALDTKKHYGKTYQDILRRVPDVSKAKQVLGWQATTSLKDGLMKTIEWEKSRVKG